MTNFSKTFAAAIIAAALLPVAANAAVPSTVDTLLSNVYIAGQAGYNNPTDSDLDNTAVFSGSVGYRFNQNFRLEGEAAYRKNDADLGIPGISAESKVANYMINGWYDFANSSFFTPYLGGGIGWSTGEAKLSGPGGSFSFDDNAFAYQLGGGVAHSLTEKLALTADYRFLDTSNFGDIGSDYKAHEIRGGVRYSF